MSTRFFSCSQAKQIDLVDYLETLGFHHQNIRNNDYWYRSPLRAENTPSFKVNRKSNLWFDHGTGKGGDIIDFGTQYFNCSISDLLQKLSIYFSFHPPARRTTQFASQTKEHPMQIVNVSAITSPSLISYLTDRGIPAELANRYCKQVEYQLNGGNYKAIGFPNDAGGYEIRSRYFKGCTPPKGISFIENGAQEVAVVEGFFDYLSLLVLHQRQGLPLTNFLVLNSLSFFDKARSLMQKHASVHLYLDKDAMGIKCTKGAIKLNGQFVDKSELYQGSKDLNEWLVKGRQQQKKAHKIKRHL